MLKHRFVRAFALTFLFHAISVTFFCGLFHAIVVEKIWNPMNLVMLFFSKLLKPTWLFYLPLLFLYVTILSRIHVKFFSVHWWIPDRRLQFLSKIIQPSTITSIIFYMFTFAFLLCYYVSFAYPSLTSLFVQCQHRPQICINPQYLFVFLTGLVFGFKYAINYFVNNLNVIKFPGLQSSLVVFVKSKLSLSTLFESCQRFGIGKEFFASVLSLYVILALLLNEASLLDVVHLSYAECVWWSFLAASSNISLVFCLIMCLILLSCNLNLSLSIFEKILTKPLEAPVRSHLPLDLINSEKKEGDSWNLSNALSSDSKLIQYLAFRQLRDVGCDTSFWGQISRIQLFSISQPGGHPHNWQGILKPSLNLIRKFSEKLKKNNFSWEKEVPVSNGFTLGTKKAPPGVEAPRQNYSQKFVSKLKEFPIFCYLLLEMPAAANRRAFAESLPVIWAVEGLSQLVASSFYDDQYGVVQKNIADVLTALTDLQQVIEKISRGVPFRRSSDSSAGIILTHAPMQDAQLRKCLKTTLRSSLYAITNTFKQSITEIPVSEEVMIKLNSYIAFQEG